MKAQKEPAIYLPSANEQCVSPVPTSSLSDDEKENATSLFITYVLVLGRSLESSRGLLELLTPALALEVDDSPLSLSLHAAAIQLWCLINSRSFSSSDKILTQAYSRLRNAIQDPLQRRCESNVLAALLLQRYERFSAVWNQHEQCHVHRNGALALLRQQKLDGINSKHRGYLISQLFHIEVNICISKKIPFQASEITWLTDQDLSILPSNPSTALDTIGASIANHQHKFYLLSADRFTTAPNPDLSQWHQDLQDTEDQLHSWPNTLPRHWLPQTLESGKHFDQSIITYEGYGDVYPNIQIASIWNLWHTYCLLLLQIKLALLDFLPSSYELVGTTRDPLRPDFRVKSIQLAQDLVDSICQSVPFHLGNYIKPASLSELMVPTILCPSYHDMEPSHIPYSLYQKSSLLMSRDDHRRHVIFQGPWHMMGTLSHVLSIFADNESNILVHALREGQMNWIRAQFLRVLGLLRIDLDGLSTNNQDTYQADPSHLHGLNTANAEIMAKKILAALAG
ncbi:unnamed protein product [Clonostachys byssicola]|uniref:Transcription factor domain-containing protein n=1 Tax=Clonostachys byssicola TaxID=160290 RepID=A0A9N9UHB3_9HYPO|nr:unnamed protein product [Clonostachys byssicola]